MILDIFARRARTAEGRLQVELAQLKYLLPRLSGQGTSLSRLGGGIGTRGPGETKLETDRRRIATRIKKLERDLERVRTGRALHRENRDAVPVPTVSLAGYTNAGKSTLFNRLTAAGVLADARMFATLDPTVRAHHSAFAPPRSAERYGRIRPQSADHADRGLPRHARRSGRRGADPARGGRLVANRRRTHVAEVFRVLGEIGASATPQILVLNKCRPTGRTSTIAMRRRSSGRAPAGRSRPERTNSRRAGQRPDRRRTGAAVRRDRSVLPFDAVETVRFRIPLRDGAAIALLHERGKVLRGGLSWKLMRDRGRAPESLRRRLSRYLVRNSTPPVENSVHK